MTFKELQLAVDRALVHQEFLRGEVYKLCKRRHTMVLPFSAINKLQGV